MGEEYTPPPRRRPTPPPHITKGSVGRGGDQKKSLIMKLVLHMKTDELRYSPTGKGELMRGLGVASTEKTSSEGNSRDRRA